MIAFDPPVRFLNLFSCIQGAVHTCTNATGVTTRNGPYVKVTFRSIRGTTNTSIGIHRIDQGTTSICVRKDRPEPAVMTKFATS
jgi:hypothetical protein